MMAYQIARATEAVQERRILGSCRLAWIWYKVCNAFNPEKQLSYLRVHPDLKSHPFCWLTIQFAAIVAFALIFFPTLLLSTGIQGVIRYWLIPFIGMHFHIGSFALHTPKKFNRVIKIQFSEEPNAQRRSPPATTRTLPAKKTTTKTSTPKVHWANIIYLGLVHIGACYGLILAFRASWTTIIISGVCYFLSCFGITGGVHRLWAHRTYNAHPSLQVVLMLLNCMANEGSIFKWARDHRLHHKHVDTPLDPHNAELGFWYSHMGWLFWHKSEELCKAGKAVHVEDLKANPIVMFQHRNYLWMGLLMCFAVPTLVCSYFGDVDQAWTGFWVAGVLRYCLVLHATWFVNSLAHLWGTRPYVSNILPCENLFVAICSIGEGWHNYHHAYPYDYSANEHGFMQWNPTTFVLDMLALCGLVTDQRRARVSVQGDGNGTISDDELPQFTMEDVKASCAQAAMLIVIDGYVYDVAEFIDQGLHPGGEAILKAYVGKDVSSTFRQGSKHSHTPVAYNLLKSFRMGRMKNFPTKKFE